MGVHRNEGCNPSSLACIEKFDEPSVGDEIL